MTISDHTTSASVEYRDLSGFPGYRALSDGRLESCLGQRGKIQGLPLAPWRPLRPCVDAFGYCYVCLRRGGRNYSRKVHRLVLEAFLGPCPEGMECRHLDGNRLNNCLENLAWGTSKENQADRVRHGTSNRGERTHWAKLIPAQVVEMRQLYESGLTMRELADRYGVGCGNVRKIVKRISWVHW